MLYIWKIHSRAIQFGYCLVLQGKMGDCNMLVVCEPYLKSWTPHKPRIELQNRLSCVVLVFEPFVYFYSFNFNFGCLFARLVLMFAFISTTRISRCDSVETLANFHCAYGRLENWNEISSIQWIACFVRGSKFIL